MDRWLAAIWRWFARYASGTIAIVIMVATWLPTPATSAENHDTNIPAGWHAEDRAEARRLAAEYVHCVDQGEHDRAANRVFALQAFHRDNPLSELVTLHASSRGDAMAGVSFGSEAAYTKTYPFDPGPYFPEAVTLTRHGMFATAHTESDWNRWLDSYVPLIQQAVAPDSWDGTERFVKLYRSNLQLVVRHTAEVHREVERLLQQLETMRQFGLEVSAEPLIVTRAQRAAWGIEGKKVCVLAADELGSLRDGVPPGKVTSVRCWNGATVRYSLPNGFNFLVQGVLTLDRRSVRATVVGDAAVLTFPIGSVFLLEISPAEADDAHHCLLLTISLFDDEEPRSF